MHQRHAREDYSVDPTSVRESHSTKTLVVRGHIFLLIDAFGQILLDHRSGNLDTDVPDVSHISEQTSLRILESWALSRKYIRQPQAF